MVNKKFPVNHIMKYFWSVGLLMLVVRSKARIINGTGIGEECLERVCGYGAGCRKGTCGCLAGFTAKIRTNTNPAVEYCLELCAGGCLTGTVCRDISPGVLRCMCDTDNGYVRSSLGACVVRKTTTTTTTNKEKAIKPSSTTVPEITGPSTDLVISIVFNGVLVAIVIILVILLFRLRLRVMKPRRQTLEHGLDFTPAEDKLDRDLAVPGVISPSYENPVAGIHNSQENDDRMVQTSNYVNTAMYEDIVDAGYINTTDPQPSGDYTSLGHPMEQVEYEKLQKP